VAECAVIGVPDARWGEAGCAFVVPAPGVALQHEALAAHCVRRLAKFKVPRNFVLVDALPRNATGKVLKTVLRQHALPERNP
jgi:fatty-acyl-CoA synthase